MNNSYKSGWGLSRRDLLRKTAIGTMVLGIGLGGVSGSALAMNKAELIEAMASEAGLSDTNAGRVLDAFTDATTDALAAGDRVALVGFGSFSVSKRARSGNRGADEREREERCGPDSEPGDHCKPEMEPVDFEPCPEFAAALDLNPGKGDERRDQSCPAGRDVDLVIDAAFIATETGGDSDRAISQDDAKKALDGFIDVTTDALTDGDDVGLGGFGSFSMARRSARTGRNPQTGKEIQIVSKNVVRFKAGAELSKAVN